MSTDCESKPAAAGRPPLQRWAIVALVLFFPFGFLLAQPCMCREGAVRGFYKSVFFLIVMTRLLYGVLRRDLQRMDFALWTGSFTGFCILVEYL
jgi:hypothetical protein